MSDFNQRKYNYGIYYCYIGLRVHGILRGIGIFTEHWYGRRVDRLYVKPEPRKYKEMANRYLFGHALSNWYPMNAFWKAEYVRQADFRRLYGIHRYVGLYMLSTRQWADAGVEWADADKSWTWP